MKTQTFLLLTAICAAALAVTTYASERYGHDDDDEFEGRRGPPVYLQDPEFTLYNAECGDCHMAYPPGLLSLDSWRRMMATLDDHFGDNAELDPATASQISDYLMRHAADRRGRSYNSSRQLQGRKGQNGQVPLRISETRYFMANHHELSPRLVSGNPEVKSISNCNACHRRAEEGSYNEHEINIPGFGRWDD